MNSPSIQLFSSGLPNMGMQVHLLKKNLSIILKTKAKQNKTKSLEALQVNDLIRPILLEKQVLMFIMNNTFHNQFYFYLYSIVGLLLF